MLGKNIKNELGAVHNLALGDVCQIVELRGRKLTVKNQHACTALQGLHFKFRHLASAHDKTRVHLGYALHHPPGYGQTSGTGQFAQFVQIAFLNDAGQGGYGNQQGARGAVSFLSVFSLTGQFFFQSLSRVHHLGRCAVPGAGLVKLIGLTVDA